MDSPSTHQQLKAETPYPNADEEISLKEIVQKIIELYHFLLSKWKTIFFAGIIGGLLGLTYSFIKKPVYTASYSFVVEDDKSGGLGGALSLASQFGFDIGASGGGAFAGDNLLELMRSRSMVQQALLSPIKFEGKEQSLANYYLTFNKLREKWSDKPGLNTIQFPLNANPDNLSRLQDSVLMTIHEKLVKKDLAVVKVDKKLSVIKVELKSTDEAFAKYFTEALVNQVSRFYIETKTQKSARNVAILQHQTDSVRQRLNAAIGGVALANDATQNINPAMQVLRAPSLQRQVDVQANTAILTELVKNLELAKLALRRETPLIQVIDKPVYPLEVDKMGKLKGVVFGGFILAISLIFFLAFKFILKDRLG